MLLFQLGCLRKYAEICFGKLSKICDMCKMFFTGLFFILWGVDQNSDPVMVLNRFGMMDIGVADLIALCYAPDEQRWYGKRLSAGDHPDVSVFIPIDK